MMFFGRDKKSDAVSKQQEAEIDLAIAARISAVVADHSPIGPDDAPYYPIQPHMLDGEPSFATSHDAVRNGASARSEPAHAMLTLVSADQAHTSELSGQHTETDGWGHRIPAAPPGLTIPAPPAAFLSPITFDDTGTHDTGLHDAGLHDIGFHAVGLHDNGAVTDYDPATYEPATYEYDQGHPATDAYSGAEAAGATPLTLVPMTAPDWTSPSALGQFVTGGTPAPVLFDGPGRPGMDDASVPAISPFANQTDSAAIDELMQQTSMRLRTLGTVNILVAGQTGVGKSTLINAVFGEQFAQTAAGRPVTQRAQWFASDSVPLRILDTRGLEAKDYAITLNDLRAEIEACRAQKDERDQIHMAWVCIASPSSRVQDCEVDIVRVLNKHDIPAIIVLTKDDDDEEFAGIVGGIMDERRAQFAAIVPVRALSKPKRAAAGLEDLVVATFTALPTAHKAAFAAAQKINRDMNKSAAEEYVIAAASAAAAASVIPIPFADMATLAPIQASMLVSVSTAFGLTLERSQIMQLITTILGCLAITVAGGWAVGNLLKFIPGPGSAIGAVLNAGMAGAMTQTLGKTYINFIYTFIETNGRVPTTNEVFEIFPSFYKTEKI